MAGQELYQQSIDKQRILVVGGGSRLISSIIEHTLRFHYRKFDLVVPSKPATIGKDSPIVIFENGSQALDYKHHIIIIGNNASSDELDNLEALANATPKGGTIIYPKAHPALNKIGSKERVDVQAIAYDVYKHEQAEGKTILISSTKEKFPIALNGDLNLQCVSAAKELVKKIGISSGNFYKAISQYTPS